MRPMTVRRRRPRGSRARPVMQGAYANGVRTRRLEPLAAENPHHAPDGVRRRGQHGGDDHHTDVLVRQPRAAAAVRRAAEQRHDVVRPAAGRRTDGAGQAAAVQHAADHPGRERQAVRGRRRSGGRRILASAFQLMTFIADFGMDVEAAAHHPRIDVSGADRASAEVGCRRRCGMRWRRTGRWRSWNTTRCRSISPART